MSIIRKSPFSRLSANYCQFKKLIIPGGNTAKGKRPPRDPPQERDVAVPTLRTSEDWCNEWPSAATFNGSCPLPMRQGIVRNMAENKGVIPGAIGNHELTKVPNFLHLTPKHISTQCEAIKVFLTEWPADLDSDELVDRHYPVEVTTRDYVMSGPSIRDERARLVTLRVPVKQLKLNGRSMDKFRLLVGEGRLEGKGKRMVLVLQADRCPTRQQNYDYLQYVLTALTRESKKRHEWEKEMTHADRPRFFWEGSPSKEKITQLMQEKDPDAGVKVKELQKYADVLRTIVNQEETEEALEEYKRRVMAILNLKAQA